MPHRGGLVDDVRRVTMLSQTLAAAVLGFALVTAAPINVIDSEFSSLDSIAMLETGLSLPLLHTFAV